jgi:hypothetical protein
MIYENWFHSLRSSKLIPPALSVCLFFVSCCVWYEHFTRITVWRGLTQLVSLSETSCERAQKVGKEWVKEFGNPFYREDQRHMQAFLTSRDKYYKTNSAWNMLPPAWADPSLEPYGGHRNSDGVKLLSSRDISGLKSPCVIYSFGGNLQTEFEESMLAKTSCSIWIFDCTVSSTAYGEVIGAIRGAENRLFFKPYCVGEDGVNVEIYRDTHVLHSVTSIMKELGHSKINLLKFDAEGAEHKALPALLQSGVQLPSQISFELHHNIVKYTGEFQDWAPVSALIDSGYVLISREDNKDAYYCCTELTFIRGCPKI